MVDGLTEQPVATQQPVAQSDSVSTDSKQVNDSVSISVNTESPQSANEKLLKQSEVNELVGRVKKDAYEKARREAEADIMARNSAVNQMPQTPSQISQRQGNQQAPQLTEEAMRVAARHELVRMQNEIWANQTAQQFVQKIEDGKSKYPDMEKVVGELNLANNVDIVNWANSVDNTADVIYELGKNPAKYANVLMLAARSPQQALKAMRELSDSIKRNQESAKQPVADKPINQLNHSTLSVSNGDLSNTSISSISRSSWMKKYT